MKIVQDRVKLRLGCANEKSYSNGLYINLFSNKVRRLDVEQDLVFSVKLQFGKTFVSFQKNFVQKFFDQKHI